jgi:EasF-like predicted methyltransferase
MFEDIIAGAYGTSVAIGGQAKHMRTDSAASNIIEIRQDREELDLLKDIKTGLRPADGGDKTLPTLLLYDEAGLKLFEKITYLDEYYLTNAEIEVLEKYAGSIAERIKPNSIVLELGSGYVLFDVGSEILYLTLYRNLRKIKILLDAFEAAKKPIEYYALDVSLEELQRTLELVPPGTYKYVQCFGLHGTYDDGLDWLSTDAVVSRPKAVLSMGSSIGNFSRADAADFLSRISAALQPSDRILFGIDGCKDSERVYHAYNDREVLTHSFIRNGLLHANKLLGSQEFDLENWEVIGEYNSAIGGHIAHVSPRRDTNIDGVRIAANERVFIEQSLKYDDLEKHQLWENAGLTEGANWMNADSTYGKLFLPISCPTIRACIPFA